MKSLESGRAKQSASFVERPWNCDALPKEPKHESKTYFITGGLGFIGAHFVHYLHQHEPEAKIVVLDKVTYAQARANCGLSDETQFWEVDIAEEKKIDALFQRHQPYVVLNFAAESHVDNSIAGPAVFLETNVKGTFTLLAAPRKLWMTNQQFKGIQIGLFLPDFSMRFGSLGKEGAFNEKSNYANNPAF